MASILSLVVLLLANLVIPSVHALPANNYRPRASLPLQHTHPRSLFFPTEPDSTDAVSNSLNLTTPLFSSSYDRIPSVQSSPFAANKNEIATASLNMDLITTTMTLLASHADSQPIPAFTTDIVDAVSSSTAAASLAASRMPVVTTATLIVGDNALAAATVNQQCAFTSTLTIRKTVTVQKPQGASQASATAGNIFSASLSHQNRPLDSTWSTTIFTTTTTGSTTFITKTRNDFFSTVSSTSTMTASLVRISSAVDGAFTTAGSNGSTDSPTTVTSTLATVITKTSTVTTSDVNGNSLIVPTTLFSTVFSTFTSVRSSATVDAVTTRTRSPPEIPAHSPSLLAAKVDNHTTFTSRTLFHGTGSNVKAFDLRAATASTAEAASNSSTPTSQLGGLGPILSKLGLGGIGGAASRSTSTDGVATSARVAQDSQVTAGKSVSATSSSSAKGASTSTTSKSGGLVPLLSKLGLEGSKATASNTTATGGIATSTRFALESHATIGPSITTTTSSSTTSDGGTATTSQLGGLMPILSGLGLGGSAKNALASATTTSVSGKASSQSAAMASSLGPTTNSSATASPSSGLLPLLSKLGLDENPSTTSSSSSISSTSSTGVSVSTTMTPQAPAISSASAIAASVLASDELPTSFTTESTTNALSSGAVGTSARTASVPAITSLSKRSYTFGLFDWAKRGRHDSQKPRLPTSKADSVEPKAPQHLRGVSIGGWLILEEWMTPDLFEGTDATDQWSFDSTHGARAKLQKHWATYFTEADVRQIASYGLNAIRIPIGLWAFDNTDTPYITGADEWLDEATRWARKYGLWILIDTHGSPRSRSDFSHGPSRKSANEQSEDGFDRTVNILKQITEKYGSKEYEDVVYGIEAVNEPGSLGSNIVRGTKGWNERVYDILRQTASNENLKVVMHDAFKSAQDWLEISRLLPRKQSAASTNFVVDMHLFQNQYETSPNGTRAGHIQRSCKWGSSGLLSVPDGLSLIVGEFSAHTDICADSDGTVSEGVVCAVEGCQCSIDTPISEWRESLRVAVRQFFETEVEVFDRSSQGWFVWSWKGPGAWGFENLIKHQIIGDHVDERKYWDVCGPFLSSTQVDSVKLQLRDEAKTNRH